DEDLAPRELAVAPAPPDEVDPLHGLEGAAGRADPGVSEDAPQLDRVLTRAHHLRRRPAHVARVVAGREVLLPADLDPAAREETAGELDLDPLVALDLAEEDGFAIG